MVPFRRSFSIFLLTFFLLFHSHSVQCQCLLAQITLTWESFRQNFFSNLRGWTRPVSSFLSSILLTSHWIIHWETRWLEPKRKTGVFLCWKRFVSHPKGFLTENLYQLLKSLQKSLDLHKKTDSLEEKFKKNQSLSLHSAALLLAFKLMPNIFFQIGFLKQKWTAPSDWLLYLLITNSIITENSYRIPMSKFPKNSFLDVVAVCWIILWV